MKMKTNEFRKENYFKFKKYTYLLKLSTACAKGLVAPPRLC